MHIARSVSVAPKTSKASRRALKDGLAALAAGSEAFSADRLAEAAEPVSPDTRLIETCELYVRVTRDYNSVGQHTWDMLCSEPEHIRCANIACALVPAMHIMEEQISKMRAVTPAGIQAKAEAARYALSGDADRDTGPMDPENALVWSLVLDMLGPAA